MFFENVLFRNVAKQEEALVLRAIFAAPWVSTHLAM